MPEFTNEVAELNELNRKIEANCAKKQRRKKKFRRKIMLLQVICMILALASFLLTRCYVIPVWLGSIVCLICALCSAYLTGYVTGYEESTV